MASTMNVESTGGTMGLYDAEPSGTARGAVVVFQEAFGVNEHIEDVCRRFAAEGYRAVSPHLFHRSGDPIVAYEDVEQVFPHMGALSEADVMADVDSAIAYLSDAGFDASRVAVVGFCMGGTVAFLAAARRSLGAAVTFYGGGITEGRFGGPSLVDLAPELQTPWLGLFGDADQGIPVEQVEALRAAVQGVGVPTEIVRYADADHGFHCDERPSYHASSAEDGWQRTLQWFDTHLAGS